MTMMYDACTPNIYNIINYYHARQVKTNKLTCQERGKITGNKIQQCSIKPKLKLIHAKSKLRRELSKYDKTQNAKSTKNTQYTRIT
jgi:hypothetical protein